MTSPEEKVVLRHLADAWNAFGKLDDHHPSDVEEFMHHVHALQNIIACRVASRADPGTWWGSDT